MVPVELSSEIDEQILYDAPIGAIIKGYKVVENTIIGTGRWDYFVRITIESSDQVFYTTLISRPATEMQEYTDDNNPLPLDWSEVSRGEPATWYWNEVEK